MIDSELADLVVQPELESQLLAHQKHAMQLSSPPKKGCHEMPALDWEVRNRKRNVDEGNLSWIVMGDVVDSSIYDQSKLQTDFARIIDLSNRQLGHEQLIRSPYTVTLGDEFQGVATSLFSAVKVIDLMYFLRIALGLTFEIRFVVYQGAIDTTINATIAHGMLGPGLTGARKLLENKSRGQHQIRFRMSDSVKARNLELLWLVIVGITKRWNPKDYQLISTMMRDESNSTVASDYRKNSSQIWKRRKTLQIEELEAVRELIFSLSAIESRESAVSHV